MAQNQNSHCLIYLLVILICSLLLSFHLLSSYDTKVFFNHGGGPADATPTSSSTTSSSSSSSTTSSSSSSSTLWKQYNNLIQLQKSEHKTQTLISPAYDFDTSFLTCQNQSQCIQPKLQVTTPIRVYLCKHTSSGGVRFFYLVRDGLLLHPQVIWYDNLLFDDIDYLIYLPNSSPWPKSECANPRYASKLIVLDEFDGALNFAPFANKEERLKHYPTDPFTKAPIWNYMFFKRSYVRREDGVFIGYPHIAKRDVFPMVYSIASGYIQESFNQHRNREIACTLRGSEKQTTRLRVQQWVAEYIATKNLTNSTHGELDTSSRQTVSKKYFHLMTTSRIIVTVNPSYWEGDFRLWESMSSGALVFCDHIMVPHPYPLLDGQHIVFFDSNNQTDLWTKLDYYLSHPEESQAIAWRGYHHAMQFHRTANFIDYVLRTALTKRSLLLQQNQTAGGGGGAAAAGQRYTYTGQYLVHKATSQMETIKRTKLPGVY